MFGKCPFLVICVLSVTSLAAEANEEKPGQAGPAERIDLVPGQVLKTREPIGGGGAADLLYDTKFSPDSPMTQKKVQVSMGCTDAHGRALNASDPGYDQCIADAQARLPSTGSSAKATPSLGVKIGQ